MALLLLFCLVCFPFFLHFLAYLIKFFLWHLGKTQEASFSVNRTQAKDMMGEACPRKAHRVLLRYHPLFDTSQSSGGTGADKKGSKFLDRVITNLLGHSVSEIITNSPSNSHCEQ